MGNLGKKYKVWKQVGGSDTSWDKGVGSRSNGKCPGCGVSYDRMSHQTLARHYQFLKKSPGSRDCPDV